jgi:tetratricopeptide (TPR) repeat protein
MKLLTALTEDWTDKQREVSWLMDDYGGDINQIAKKMSILPSVVRKHITAAKYYAYKSVWDSIEEYYVALDEQLTGERPAQGKNYLAYYNAALRKYGQNDFSKAVPLFEKAIKLADQDQDINNEQKAEMYCRMAENYVHYGKSKYKKALEVIEKAKMLQTDLPKARKQYIETLYCESQIYTNKKNREEAVLLLEEALALAVSFLQSNDLFIAVMKNDAAVNYIGLKDYKKAIEHLTDSIRIEEANGFTNTTGYLNHLRNLAFCYEQIGEYHQALQLRHKVKEMHGGKTASGHR